MSANCGTVIVTGGGRGIGAAVARLAARHGYGVAVNYVANERAAISVAGEIEKQHGRASAIQGDVSQEEDVARLFDFAERTLGRVTALVHNAAITGGFSRLQDLEARTLERVLAVNVIGATLCDTLTIGLAREVASDGIRVHAVAPGLVETEIHAAAGDPDRPQRLASGIPLGRSGKPQEIAEAVLWLLSPAAAYITGTILPVSGGR